MSDSALERMLAAGGSPTFKPADWTPPSAEDLQLLLPDYEVQMLVGRGGMGAVYRGVQRSLDRAVAIKILPAEMDGADAQFAARFKQEARAMAKLSHPNIVPVHDFGEAKAAITAPRDEPPSASAFTPQEHGLLYFVMDFVDGTDLAHIIRSEGHLSPRKAASIISQVCDALEFAHEAGIVHRDIKPSNVMLDKRGQVKVADFGLAKSLEAKDILTTAATMTGTVMGTLAYMAPEQAQGRKVDHRADIYSVGAMFYEMLTGEAPHGAIEPPSHQRIEVDVRLDQIVLKALARDPDRRYQRASEVKTDLTHVETHPQTARRWNKAALFLGALTLLALVIFAAAALLPPGGRFITDSASSAIARGDTSAAAPPPVDSIFPLGQWVKRWTRAAEIQKTWFDGGATWADGWITPGPGTFNGITLSNGGPVGRNWGARARYRWTSSGHATVRLRVRGSSIAHDIEHYQFRVRDGLMYFERQKGGGNADSASQKFTLSSPEPVQLAEGSEVIVEAFVIGDRLYGRVNGKLVTTRTDGVLTSGAAYLDSGFNAYRDLEFINLDGISEAEALKAAGLDGASALLSSGAGSAVAAPATGDKNATVPVVFNPLFPPGQWVKRFTDKSEIHQQWFDLGTTWDNGWITGKSANDNGIGLDAPNARGRNWGARARYRWAGGGRADIALRRGSLAPANTATVYQLHVVPGRAYFLRYAGRGKQAGSDVFPLGPPVSLPLSEGQEFVAEACVIGDALYGRVDGKIVCTKTDGALTEGGVGISAYSMPFRNLEFINLDGLSEAEALRIMGFTEAAASLASSPAPSASAKPTNRVFPSGQWATCYTHVTDINQQWLDAGATWQADGWITPAPGINNSIVLPSQAARGKNWGARASYRWVGGGIANIVLRRNGAAANYTVAAYGFRVESGRAYFYRQLGKGKPNVNDVFPLGDPVPLELTQGQEITIEAFVIGDTLHGRVAGKRITVKTDGILTEGGFELSAQHCHCRAPEFINLDGLTEAEALKAAGLE